jgi:hypothetical protein
VCVCVCVRATGSGFGSRACGSLVHVTMLIAKRRSIERPGADVQKQEQLNSIDENNESDTCVRQIGTVHTSGRGWGWGGTPKWRAWHCGIVRLLRSYYQDDGTASCNTM